jgi:hypothetical protein
MSKHAITPRVLPVGCGDNVWGRWTVVSRPCAGWWTPDRTRQSRPVEAVSRGAVVQDSSALAARSRNLACRG